MHRQCIGILRYSFFRFMQLQGKCNALAPLPHNSPTCYFTCFSDLSMCSGDRMASSFSLDSSLCSSTRS